MTSSLVAQAIHNFFTTGQNGGAAQFGVTGLIAAGGNAIAQFVGSFNYAIGRTDSGDLAIDIFNVTSLSSLTNKLVSDHPRGQFPWVMGNTLQEYQLVAPCR